MSQKRPKICKNIQRKTTDLALLHKTFFFFRWFIFTAVHKKYANVRYLLPWL